MPYMSLSHPFTSLVLFCLLAGCAIKEGPDSAQTTDNLFDREPSAAADKEPSAAHHKEPSAATDKEPSAAYKEPSAAHKEPSAQDSTVVQTNLWQRMRDGFRLSHETDRKRVMDELKWYVNHPEYIERVTKRAAPHLHYLIEELEKRGLPLEFALLPIIESAYDPFAYSHSRAAGLWQFIPGTARVYGLKIDWWYDGRRDVRASTTAAIDYLEYLHNMLGEDWLLALAAYNAGQGNVLSSIRASKLPADEVNFWSLKVFRETYTYVPRLLAISELINHPDRYHMTLPDVANKPYWEVVETMGQLDLNKAAELADVSSKEIYLLNAGFNQWATHPDGPHELIIPVGKADVFRERVLELAPTERLAWQRHKVSYGESLGTIANKYRTTVGTIRSANNIRGNLIRAGESLMIPAASPDADYAMSQSSRLATKQQTLETHYGSEPITYIVKPGDSFWEIAHKFDVGMRELAKWNGMGTTGLLHPGTELKIFKKTNNTQTKAQPVGLRTNQVRKLNYRVRNGESLSLIASKFNISVQSIKSWNDALNVKKYIHPGDQLTLYVDVTRLIN
jgi:membrane-bound lytic murein transglycosylase D